MIGESAPGTYYLTTAGERASVLMRPSPTFAPRRVAFMMAVWLAAIGLPLVVWLITR